jgi:hypothetical protein
MISDDHGMRSVRSFASIRLHTCRNATLNLAASLVVRGQPEPEEAARLGVQAIAVPQGQRTETVRKRAVELLRLLENGRVTAAVKDFAERLRDYEPATPTT